MQVGCQARIHSHIGVLDEMMFVVVFATLIGVTAAIDPLGQQQVDVKVR
jgi:hypothetical protein